MPKSAFSAIENSLRAFLGGAKLSLTVVEGEERASFDPGNRQEILAGLQVGKVVYRFTARRNKLPFTATENSFIQELFIAFEGLFAGFSSEGYADHFRTALLTSLTDIAVARYIRGDRKGVFWPIQSLIQLLKSLSYQRYEGSQATTGFLVYRTQLEDFLGALEKTRYSWLDLEDSRQRITRDFFINPLSLMVSPRLS